MELKYAKHKKLLLQDKSCLAVYVEGTLGIGVHNINRGSRRIRTIIKALVFLPILFVFVPALHAGLGAGYSEYYVPVGESESWSVQNYVQPTKITTDDKPTMHSIISITATADNTVVYYDHWETGGIGNGYNLDETNLAATADLSFTLNKGETMVLESKDMHSDHSNPDSCTVVSGPAGRTDDCFDGGDRFIVAGGPVAVARASWNDVRLTYFQMAWEVYPVKALDSNYTVPFGEDISGDYTGFERSSVVVTATQDNTNVTLGATSVALNKGESKEFLGVNSGDEIISNKPIYASGAIGSNARIYELRGYSLVSTSAWTNSYYSPVGSKLTEYDNKIYGKTDIYIYNPHSSPITISYSDQTGSGTFEVAANSTEAYSDADNVGREVAENSAAFLESTDTFWGIVSSDAEKEEWDWGHSLIPTTYLKSEYYIGWAPETNDKSVIGSPLYITPEDDNTQVFIDLPPLDGVADFNYTINRLDSLIVHDTNDTDSEFDLTGARIYATGRLAIAWGARAVSGTGGPNYMDIGYAILPQKDEWINLILTIDKTADREILSADTAETVRFTLTTRSYSGFAANVNVKDIMPDGFSYVAGNTVITLADGTTVTGAAADPSIDGQELVWDSILLGNMDENKYIDIEFDTLVDANSYHHNDLSINNVEVNATHDNDVFIATDSYINHYISRANLITVKTVDNSTPEEGDNVTFTIKVTNDGVADAHDVNLTDTLPTGITYTSNTRTQGTYSQTTGLWEIGTLNNGDIATLTLTGKINDGTVGSTITNVTTAANGNEDDNTTAGDDLNESVTIKGSPSIAIVKTGTLNDGGDGLQVGDTISYDFNVSNTGNVALHDVKVNDARIGVSNLAVPDLAVGAYEVVSSTYSITAQDIIDGNVTNQALAEGTSPDNVDVNDTSDDNSPSEDDPTITALEYMEPDSLDDTVSLPHGSTATLDIVNNDKEGSFPLDLSTVSLIAPDNAINIIEDDNGDIISFVVQDEGSWSIDPVTGSVTFVPETEFIGDPTPVEYIVQDTQGHETSSTIFVNYPPVANNDYQSAAEAGDTVSVVVLTNDTNTSYPLDPERVSLVTPDGAVEVLTDNDGDTIGFAVPNEGVWTVDEVTGEVTFEPEVGFEENPTPVNYTVCETGGDVSNEATIYIDYPELPNTFKIGDTFWIDYDGDMVYDGGDKGVDEPIPGALVELLDDNGSKLYWVDVGHSSLTTSVTDWPIEAVTDSGGHYGIYVPEGVYKVRFNLPQNYLDSGHDFIGQSSSSTNDKDISTANQQGVTQSIRVGPGYESNNLTLDAAVDCGCENEIVLANGGDALGMLGALFMVIIVMALALLFIKREENIRL